MKQMPKVYTNVLQYHLIYEARPYVSLFFGGIALVYACKHSSFTCLVGSAVLISCSCVILNWRAQYRRRR